MIFPVLKIEKTVQVDDRTRLDARKTYITPDEAAITLIEIEPESGAGFFDVTSAKYLDYQYSTEGDKAISLRVTTDGSPELSTKTLPVQTEADDKLFSSDSEIIPYEPNILDWTKEGRNSFLDVHRASQERILKYLDENRFWDKDGNALTKEDVIIIEEFKDWSKFMTLRLIFEGLSNATDDIFHEKALRYRQMELEARDRAKYRVDLNNDATVDANEALDFRSIEIHRV